MQNLFIDLDDVIVDFRLAAAKAHGWPWDEVERRGLTANSWSMAEWFDMSSDEFWEPINLIGEVFWRSLSLKPWAYALINLAKQSGMEWYIATSPNMSDSVEAYVESHIGKMKWLSTFLGADLHRAFINSNKHLLGNAGDILIDDRPANIEAFEDRGGHGILFPLLGNSARAQRHNPIPYIKEKLCTLTKHG
jgi:5'(3')-deoxyribonucleotidase